MQIPQNVLDRLTDRDLSVVTYIVVHHTADSNQYKDIEEIAREEIASQGFVTVGYHAVIQGDGKVQYGRPIGKVPAANLGPGPVNNTASYAIALEGNFHPGSPGYTGERPTWAQLVALVSVVANAKRKLPNLRFLIGHRDVARIDGAPEDATACPGDRLYSLLPYIRIVTRLAAV
jgi:hypothetical protein